MLAQLVSYFMRLETITYMYALLNTNIFSVIVAISSTDQVTTILKFAGSSMIWQIVTKSPIPPIKTPNPSITIWSNAANVAALIKLDYLNTILSWLDIVGPRTSSGWKAIIGVNTVCVPSLTPKATVVNVWELLDPTQICLVTKELEGKCDEGDGHFNETLPTTNTSTSSDKVSDGDTSAGVPDDSLKQVGDETIGPDNNDDDKCNKSHNEEGVKFGNDDPGLRVSPKI